MDKSTMLFGLAGVIAVVTIIVFIAVSGGDNGAQESSPASTNTGSTSLALSEGNFAKLEAEVLCKFLDVIGGDFGNMDLVADEADFRALLVKYDVTEEEFNALRVEHEEDVSFQELALEEMNGFCPELLAE